MLLPSRRRRNKELDQAATSIMRPAWQRTLLMLVLLLVIGGVYWRHFDNRLASIQAESAFNDETGAWTDADKRSLARRANLFREHWGVTLMAHVSKEQPLLPKLTKTTLFIGMSPGRAEAVLVLPGLASHAVKTEGLKQGYDIRLALEQDLARCIQAEPAKDCLNRTLDDLQALLENV